MTPPENVHLYVGTTNNLKLLMTKMYKYRRSVR